MSTVSTVDRHFQVNTVQVEKGNKHAREVGKTALAWVFTSAWLCVFTLRGSAMQAGALCAPLALRTQRLTMRNWRFDNLYRCCPSLIAATWWAGDEKWHLKKMKPGVIFGSVTFYQQEAAARRQNPGSARRTAANADLAVITQLEPTGGVREI